MSAEPSNVSAGYRGRVAPTPTGFLHLGHAATFRTAWKRAREAGGQLVYRVEDLDAQRCRPEYAEAAVEDLRWAGIDWDEGPDCGGPFGPYVQSQRLDSFLVVWRRLYERGLIYPCRCSRKDVLNALDAPHEEKSELIYPGTCRPEADRMVAAGERWLKEFGGPGPVNWRFRVPDGEVVEFDDLRAGRQCYRAGREFGDFLIWRKDGFPSYELAVVTDDHAMEITEVVRGEDLLVSTARQILLYQGLGWAAPQFYHCPLARDEQGRRLAKRDRALGLRELRKRGVRPDELEQLAILR